MKIGIIGASGKAGSLIASEAKSRGYDVTAIVRNAAKVAGKGYTIIEKDIYELTSNDLRQFDAVINAFGTPFGQNKETEHQKTMDHLIKILENLPDTRFLMVGGAGSLYTSPDMKHQAVENIPEAWRAVPTNMAAALEKLRVSKVNWTYFSPALTFDFKGERTGKYQLGGEFVLKNSSGDSYISYADYAIAMIDEIAENRFSRMRFTAVSEEKPGEPAAPAEEYYGIGEKPIFEGLSQYREPLCFELNGKKFDLVMDNGDDYSIYFLSESKIEWRRIGEPKHCDLYECLKADETTYFVNFEATGIKPRTGISVILDTAQRLATLVKTYTDFTTKYPSLVESKFVFGAIDMPGFDLPKKRHAYTIDLLGKRIEWSYSPTFAIMHVYYHTSFVRASIAGNRAERSPSPEEAELRAENPYDEPAVYIKVKDGIYIVSIIEQHMSRRGLTGNSLLFLMNLKRVHDVGRSFGLNKDRKPENYLFSAFGKWVKSDGTIEALESKYRT